MILSLDFPIPDASKATSLRISLGCLAKLILVLILKSER